MEKKTPNPGLAGGFRTSLAAKLKTIHQDGAGKGPGGRTFSGVRLDALTSERSPETSATSPKELGKDTTAEEGKGGGESPSILALHNEVVPRILSSKCASSDNDDEEFQNMVNRVRTNKERNPPPITKK